MTRAEMALAELKGLVEAQPVPRHVVTSAPLRDARGEVLEFHTVSPGVPGSAAWVAPETVPPMAHLNAHNCQSSAPMRFAVPQSTVKVMSVAEGATSPLDARLKAEARAKDAAIAGLQQEVRALRRHVGLAEPEKPAQGAVGAAVPYVSPEQQIERMQRQQWADLRRDGASVDYTRLGVVRR